MYKYFYKEMGDKEARRGKINTEKREEGRVTELWVRRDNGIIALNYNYTHPSTLFQSSLVCSLFAKSRYKICLAVA